MATDTPEQTTHAEQFIAVFRAVCDDEFNEWSRTHTFALCANSVEGRWFALKREDAVAWGVWFAAQSGRSHDRIIAVRIPKTLFEQFAPKYDRLDSMGPAVFAAIDLLRDQEFEEVME